MEDYIFSELSAAKLEKLLETERRFQEESGREMLLLACEKSKPEQQ